LPGFDLAKDREPQKFGIGLKELWKSRAGEAQPGLVQHTLGWPLDNSTGGGSFLYHLEDNQVVVGFVLHLNYKNPTSRRFEEFQRFKQHPSIRAPSKAASASPTARAPSPRADGNRCRSSPSRRRADRLRGGLRQRSAHQGLAQRDPVGMMAAGARCGRAREGRIGEELTGYEDAWRASDIGRDLKKVRNVKPFWSKLGTTLGFAVRRSRHVDQHARVLAVRHAQTWQAGCGHARASREVQADRLSDAGRRGVVRQALVRILSNTNHEEDQPSI
jgi:electron-transferring-flavoprotein dehydrogenase